ncbi:MAG: FixH family protein [Pseudomonadota bacterium]
MMAATEKKLTGRMVLSGLIGFFALVIGMNILMASFALGTFDGTTEPDAYRQGLGFNARIAAKADAKQLGWVMAVEVDMLDPGTNTVRIDVTPEGVRSPIITGLLWRQTADGMDVELPFAPVGDGTYSAIAQLPALGRWELRLLADKGGESVKFREELFF